MGIHWRLSMQINFIVHLAEILLDSRWTGEGWLLIVQFCSSDTVSTHIVEYYTQGLFYYSSPSPRVVESMHDRLHTHLPDLWDLLLSPA